MPSNESEHARVDANAVAGKASTEKGGGAGETTSPRSGKPKAAPAAEPLVKNAKKMVATKQGKPPSSKYRGVTQHRRTGRWEAHVWDNGQQVYLGGFDTEERAGRAYDIVALKCRGSKAEINFSINDYTDVLAQVAAVSRDELVSLLRRRSKGFSRGSSKFRGVTRHKGGRWESRMGQYLGRKYGKAEAYSPRGSRDTNYSRRRVPAPQTS